MSIVLYNEVQTLKIVVNSDFGVSIELRAVIYVDDFQQYSVEIHRHDSYKISPSFEENYEADELIYVKDDFFEASEKKFTTVDEAKKFLVKEIQDRLLDSTVTATD
jgi:hypothetical protein